MLEELRYEITRGMMEGDLDPCLAFSFIVPVKDELVRCEFRTRPEPPRGVGHAEPRLRVVK